MFLKMGLNESEHPIAYDLKSSDQIIVKLSREEACIPQLLSNHQDVERMI